MKPRIAAWCLPLVCCAACAPHAARVDPKPATQTSPADRIASADDSPDLAAWRRFVKTLRDGTLTTDNLRPYRPEWGEQLRGMLTTLAQRTTAKGVWREWDARPEVHRDGSVVHYLVDLSVETADGRPHTYCFTFVTESGAWFFRNLESILLRLDTIAPAPTAVFPDAPEERKAWMRTELAMTERVRLFNFLAKEKGREAAFRWFEDGGGYAMMARTWVPFVNQRRAFVLFACWEQAKLRGNAVTLERLDEREAAIVIHSDELLVYERATHLKPAITLDDYRGLVETIWKDRAQKAGWQGAVSFREGGILELRLRQ